MATPILMPRQGQSVETCQITAWKKHKGDPVDAGETICEVETDKAAFEVETPESGVLLATFFPEGADVPVLTAIAVVGAPDEDGEDLRPARGESPPAAGKGATVAEGAHAPTVAAESDADAGPATAPVPPNSEGRCKASPRALGTAAANGIDILALSGSGPGGRIIERDVLAALATASDAPVTDVTGPLRRSSPGLITMTPADVPGAPAREIPVERIRKVIADRMLQSLQTTAQFTLTGAASAESMLAYRRRLKGETDETLRRITINDIVHFAVIKVLKEFGNLNSLFLGDRILQYNRVNLGFAVDTPRGLMVPVISDAETLSLRELSQAADRLREACVDGRAAPDDLKGGTFTVSNLGNLGVEAFTPVLNPPQVAILGVGVIRPRPIAVNADTQFAQFMSLSLTVNHQAVDGAPAARFLKALSETLGNLDGIWAM